jgi:two-component system capsular synthesis sensor histidine kinase RcsC
MVEYTKAVVSETPKFTEMPSLQILVIDDEDFVRETLADMLETLGHKVVAVEGGASAFNEMSKQHFDIVFTDLSMPQIDGWEIAHFIRSQWDDTNIVMVTGYGVGVQSPNGELDLIDGVIGKPFDFDQVTETISQVMLNSKRTPIPINTQYDESAMVH